MRGELGKVVVVMVVVVAEKEEEKGVAMVPTWKTEAEDLEFLVSLGYMVVPRQRQATSKQKVRRKAIWEKESE